MWLTAGSDALLRSGTVCSDTLKGTGKFRFLHVQALQEANSRPQKQIVVGIFVVKNGKEKVQFLHVQTEQNMYNNYQSQVRLRFNSS